MIQRAELEQFLSKTFQYDAFQDYCHNGLQVEGKDTIHRIACGVSLNLPFLEKAITWQTDAIIVHHGFFGKEFFHLKGAMKENVRRLLVDEISLFGIHLPLDAHKQYGNNAQLFSCLEADILEPFDVGFIGENIRRHSLSKILNIFHHTLHPKAYQVTSPSYSPTSVLTPQHRHGFLYYSNGPDIPKRLAIISGGASRTYRSETLRDKGIDTFMCGSVDETTSAISYETQTNFVNLGHYWSEKPGILALKTAIDSYFEVDTVFIDVDNAI